MLMKLTPGKFPRFPNFFKQFGHTAKFNQVPEMRVSQIFLNMKTVFHSINNTAVIHFNKFKQ